MKMTCFAKPIALALIASAAFVGCKNSPIGVTKLDKNGSGGALVGDPSPSPAISNTDPITSAADLLAKGSELNSQDSHRGWPEDASMFQTDIVHFDFDSATVRTSEQSKLAAVADYLKTQQANAIRVEGHCDERGTEEYNRSLGERRAIALREELIRLGINPTRVDTRSYGEDKPGDTAHNEAAYSKNRRGEFILLSPPRVVSNGNRGDATGATF
jgi:peptidoglycan-associated lipoprotein